MDLVTRLPVEIWFHENPRAADTHFEAYLLDLASAQTLLLLDRGFYHYLSRNGLSWSLLFSQCCN